LVDESSSDPARTAPVWLGEFGTVTDTLWWNYMLRYLGEREVSWAYWSINGDPKHPYMALLRQDSATVRDPWKLQGLQELMKHTCPSEESPGTSIGIGGDIVA